MAAGDLAMPGASELATMIMTLLNRINSGPARQRLKYDIASSIALIVKHKK